MLSTTLALLIFYTVSCLQTKTTKHL